MNNAKIEYLKKIVLEENLELVKKGLVIYTWGNVSGIDRDTQKIVIKPSGVDYGVMTEKDMVVTNFDKKTLEGKYKASSDLPTHIELYKAFDEIGGVVHTHSTYATAFAQARHGIPALGTTHADYFCGDIPCTRTLTKEEVENDYERNTALVIIETLKNKNIGPMAVPGVIVASHGVFTWGKDAKDAVHNAVVLEELAKMAYLTLTINPSIKSVERHLLDKHYNRKHGKNAYYGQN